MNIRNAETRDIEAILAIWNPAIRDSLATFNSIEKSPADIEAMITDRAVAGHAFIVAEDGGAIVGFAYFSQFRGGKGYAHTMEHTIYLAPEARGRGAGRALMIAIEDRARKAGAHTIFAGVSAENEAGIAFHQRLGYQELARLPEVGYKFGRWLDLVLFQKHL